MLKQQLSPAIAMDEIETLVHTFRCHKHAELEVLFSSSDVVNGVEFALFNKLFKSLSASAERGVLCAINKSAIVDFHYVDNIRTRYEAGKRCKTVQKIKLARYDVVCKERPNVNIRVNLKNEIPVNLSDCAPKMSPIFVRLQEVWTFCYKGRFEYTLKKTVSGETQSESCKNDPIYEIELEMLRNKDWLENTCDLMITENLISKILHLCGRYDNEIEGNLRLIPKYPPLRKPRKRRRKECGNLKKK